MLKARKLALERLRMTVLAAVLNPEEVIGKGSEVGPNGRFQKAF